MAQLVGLATIKTGCPSALVRLKFEPPTPLQRKLSTFVIFVKVSPILVIIFLTSLNQLFCTITMMLASNGCTIWLLRLHTTLSLGKIWFGNRCKIKPSMFNTSLAESIQQTYLLKKCRTAHISVVFGIHLCQDCQTSSIHQFINHQFVTAGNPSHPSVLSSSGSPHCCSGNIDSSSFILSLCSCIIFILSYLHCHFTSLQCWLPAFPKSSWVCSISPCIALVSQHFGPVFFLGCMDGGGVLVYP